ncbi:hypothetical protein PYCCODRAFT_1447436 [Trametes coccinea BRFM310]|uniref:DDE Tnp4 domain-containing protein n=1 Tax=Trametes coccinea (strain BRFM310) TaxID=1353009 RepID=A0A1Y2IBN8_TRAC3|nr:hypothetical protein PYCCODRAFT_1447436 [Trametes coccinea BRFM310]
MLMQGYSRVFRFTQEKLLELPELLELPQEIVTPSGYCFTRTEAFALTCACLRTPADLDDLASRYNRASSAILEAINWVVSFLDVTWSYLLDFNHTGLLPASNLNRYTKAIYHRSAPIRSVWGFIDCTLRAICQPSRFQHQMYNGHKKLMLPNGMFGHLLGPFEGWWNNNHLLHASQLLEKCSQFAVQPGIDEHTPVDRGYFQLFGDATYRISPVLISPSSGPGERSADKQAWNAAMGSVRVYVEHGFAIVSNTWPFLNANWKMHVFRSLVGRYYHIGVLLTNVINCYRPNQVAQYFDCEPPVITEYLHH